MCLLNTVPSRVIYRCGGSGRASKMGGWKQVWTGLLDDVEFRDCGDHMFWTRKIQTWMCSRSVEE